MASIEIERLSITHGRDILSRAHQAIGQDQACVFGFLRDHVALDVGHTAFNRSELAALLSAHPDTQGPLLAAGAAALDAYGAYLDDCLGGVRSVHDHGLGMTVGVGASVGSAPAHVVRGVGHTS